MSWIKKIEYSEAGDRLKALYDRIRGKGNYIDNILKVHGLRPHTLEGHMSLYKNVLHHKANTLPGWILESLGVYVSFLNGCDYCVAHHFAGLKKLLRDESRADQIKNAIESGDLPAALNENEITLFVYAQVLTKDPGSISRDHIERLKENGYDEGEILEANQVISYFAYANRTVNGLGVNTEGDVPGLAPTDQDDASNWSHQ